jgi:CheY-like chemotaxis protein
VRPNILVFNHSSNLLLLYSYVLKQYGYHVTVYQQELTTITEIEAAHPDLLILGNIRNSSDRELQLVYKIKAHPDLKHIPVIICSTSVEILTGDPTLHHQTSVFLVSKPFDLPTFLTAIRHAINVGVE